MRSVGAAKMLRVESDRYTTLDAGSDIGPRAFAMTLMDDSMVAKPPKGEESFRKGDIVVFDPDQKPKAGDFVCVVLSGEDEAVFRKYRPSSHSGGKSYDLVPLNEDYRVEQASSARPAQIIGRMIRSIRNH